MRSFLFKVAGTLAFVLGAYGMLVGFSNDPWMERAVVRYALIAISGALLGVGFHLYGQAAADSGDDKKAQK